MMLTVSVGQEFEQGRVDFIVSAPRCLQHTWEDSKIGDDSLAGSWNYLEASQLTYLASGGGC